MPEEGPHAPHSLLVVGSLADVVEDQFLRLFDVFGIAPVSFSPCAKPTELTPVGPNTSVLFAQPFLRHDRALEERGAKPHLRGFIRAGHGCWLRAAEHFWSRPGPLRGRSAPGRARAAHAIDRSRGALSGKCIFLFPDSQLELPLRAFLPANWE